MGRSRRRPPLPPAAPYIDIRPYHRPAAASTRPATSPATRPVPEAKPLLIIPKSLIDPPALEGPGRSVASVRPKLPPTRCGQA